VPCVSHTNLLSTVKSLIAETQGRHVASQSASALLADSSLHTAPSGASDPHGLADVKLGIITAELAVAENAAVLLTGDSLPERALAFLSEEVLVLVREDRLVADLITAQARLPVPPPFYLAWVAGPSKTADIEQALVIGAHGPRNLMVLPYS
jgi:L-lactate dehydrogenase complex protein LldG